MTAWNERTPGSRQAKVALCAIGLSAVVFVAIVPFAAVQLPPVHAFIPAYEAALITCDLVTAALLFGQFAYFRSAALLCLASGYLFTGSIALVHGLTFPGMITQQGLLGAGMQTTAWLYMFWHSGFPLFVCGYVFLGNERGRRMKLPLQGIPAVLAAAGVVLAVVAALSLFATRGAQLLPEIMAGPRHTESMILVVGTVWALSALALTVLSMRATRTVLDLWLSVVMWAWVFDIGLGAVLNAGRFDLGFYAGRIYGLIASSVVLIALLVENGRLYADLAERNLELEKARNAAIAAEAAKGAFIATMSHEIRTPMNGVMGMIELLSLTELTGEQRTSLEVVRESGRSLMRIIDDILDFSKIDAGKLELRPEAASLASIVGTACEVYSANAESKGLALRWSIDRNLGAAYLIDSMRLRQVLQNLVSNAIKFTSRGSVSVRADLHERRADADVVRLSVRDTGPGIEPGDRERLFKPFSQGATGSPGGTGLGLSICARLASLMGGRLEMESRVGEGTFMTVTLPLVRVPMHALQGAKPIPAEVPARTAPPQAFGGAILLVDDHPVNRMVMARQLRAIGYAPVVASSGEQALEALGTGTIRAVLTDCQMPGMDGYELTRRIRAKERETGAARIPIIACTANAMHDEAARCFEAGMDDYISKPISLDQLSGKLGRWIGAGPAMDAPSVDPEILAEFWRYNTRDMRDLKSAVTRREAEAALRSAHRIKGAAAAIEIASLAAACGELERAARVPDWQRVDAALAAIESEASLLGERIGAAVEE